MELELANHPANVTLVRSLVTALAETIDLDGALRDRLRTAVSEAANNVVVHAYDNTSGMMCIELIAGVETIEVLVTDHGRGIRPAMPSGGHMKLGLAIISTLSDHAEFVSGPGEGVEVHMTFRRDAEGNAAPAEVASDSDHQTHIGELDGDIVVSIEPPAALGQILGDLSRAVAEQSRFENERIADLREITDTLAATATTNADRQAVGFSITAADRRLDLQLGPLPIGSGATTRAARTDSGVLVGDAVDVLSVKPTVDGSEFVTLRVTDARQTGRS